MCNMIDIRKNEELMINHESFFITSHVRWRALRLYVFRYTYIIHDVETIMGQASEIRRGEMIDLNLYIITKTSNECPCLNVNSICDYTVSIGLATSIQPTLCVSFESMFFISIEKQQSFS